MPPPYPKLYSVRPYGFPRLPLAHSDPVDQAGLMTELEMAQVDAMASVVKYQVVIIILLLLFLDRPTSHIAYQI